jgi:hypothetical protein
MELQRLRNLIVDIHEISIDKVEFDTDAAIQKGYAFAEIEEVEQIIKHTPKTTQKSIDIQFEISWFCIGKQMTPKFFYLEEAGIVYLFFPEQLRYYMVLEEQLTEKLGDIYNCFSL